MATLEFHFKSQNSWNMGPACGSDLVPSTNPAPATTAGIYIIHNSTENSTYVGYADNCYNRWQSRYEVFHAMGIKKSYGKGILCAYCLPTMDVGSMFLEGYNNCEHALIRAVVNGLLGVTQNTNTQLANTPFINKSITMLRVLLPTDPWGKLLGARQVALHKSQHY
ncbi:hypothetical protein ID144_17075 [Pseudomonas sp. JM0905a]|uniref:GIY-YIG nuclease family protein n=1 Tax=Metapseudomonas resinovorans TaxID=53412 RepID=A0ABT4YCE5_METRE|nr:MULTISPECIES: hypothetical protein [Pseudomonas]MBD2838758.1 hypothetical protein [Pseudomonas sp. JM0905a]MDA8486575.1 GIY-YIG nuclease family protein [Pseudomonas resinovorans]